MNLTKYNYSNLVKFANKYDCEILDSEELINILPDRIKIKSKCGHNTMETINNFMKNKLGIYCKDCMNLILNTPNILNITCSNSKCKKIFIPDIKSFLYCSKFCSHSREQSIGTKNKISTQIQKKLLDKNILQNDSHLYKNGNIYLNDIIQDDFYFEITNRCGAYNHIIKPKNLPDNNLLDRDDVIKQEKTWLPIEIKYSNSLDENYYYFSIHKKKNENMIMLYISLSDNSMWLFPPNIIKFVSKLKINKVGENQFSQYNINSKDLISKLKDFYHLYMDIRVGLSDSFTAINTSNPHFQVENEYKKKRIDSIKFLQFQNPISNFESYNFSIGCYKIQECVSYISKTIHSQIVSIHKKSNGVNCAFSYLDNDFYWIHERICDNFYLIPSDILFQKEFLSSVTSKGKTSLNISTNQSWLSKFVFSYQTINEEENKNKILKMFNP